MAQKAVSALKNKGIQAQMAKVNECGVALSTSLPVHFLHHIMIIFVVEIHAVIHFMQLIYYGHFGID